MGLILLWVVMGIVVALIANAKGRDPGLWFLYGAAIWPIALVHILVAAPNQQQVEALALRRGDSKKCPFCAELIKVEAKKCRFCGSILDEPTVPEPVSSPLTPPSAASDTTSGPGAPVRFMVTFGVLAVVIFAIVGLAVFLLAR